MKPFPIFSRRAGCQSYKKIRRPLRPALVYILVSVGAVAVACARPEPPRGGPEDRLPPVVIETVPDTFSVVEEGLREFNFRFSERISEQPEGGSLDRAVVISPTLGEVRVRHRRDGLRVQTEEGLRPGQVYRITVRAVVRDMFGNSLQDPFDLVVSTGAEITPNVVAGVVEKRIEGEAAPSVVVRAVFGQGEDTVTHWNYTDDKGIFTLRYVPGGAFRATAFEDANRDGDLDLSELRSLTEASGELSDAPDTSFIMLSLVPNDTTGPRLTDATAEDSVTLRLEFAEHLDPDRRGVTIAGWAIRQSEEGDVEEEIPLRFFHEYEYTVWQAEQAKLRADSTQAEAGSSETAEGEDDQEDDQNESAEDVPEPATGSEVVDTTQTETEGRFGLSGLRLPSQMLIAIPEVAGQSWQKNVEYNVVIGPTVSISGVQGQQDTVTFIWEVAEQDSAEASSDSTAAAADTAAADTTALPPDTTVLPPDTTVSPPDTLLPPFSRLVVPRPPTDVEP